LNYETEPLRQNGVRKLLDKYCREAEITKRVTPHSLRHTFATHKAAHPAVTTFMLQDLLGHANADTTRRYVHESKVNALKVQEATAL
jgi:site-specific recombinase XerD